MYNILIPSSRSANTIHSSLVEQIIIPDTARMAESCFDSTGQISDVGFGCNERFVPHLFSVMSNINILLKMTNEIIVWKKI